MKKAILLIPMLALGFVAYCQTRPLEEIIIDETDKEIAIVQTIEIDEVWTGHPVGFCLLTNGNRQYIAYYNADKHMVVGQRNLNEDAFHLHVMDPTYRDTHGGTSTVLGWDSHNYVTLGMDRQGYIHLSGNMHVHPLTYFRSTEPHDISTLKQVMNMTGSLENRVTYPKFMTDRNGNLIFHYRDGGSGNGNEIYNIYSAESKSWERLLDVPLTDGEEKMNAYQTQPTLKSDNWYHVWWVWRDTPDCATNHDLSYMKSPDLENWYNAFGEPVELPATLRNKSLIVDPVPPGGGIINLSARLCLDENKKPVFIYHKYGPEGNLQLFAARVKGNSWVSKQITNWDYRWEFSGGGSIVVDVRLKDFLRRDDGYYEFSYWHVKQGNNTLLLDGNFDIVGEVLKAEKISETVKVEGDFPGLEVRTAEDIGQTDEKNVRYFLKWESLASNRDRPRPKPWPGPGKLYLYKTKIQSETKSAKQPGNYDMRTDLNPSRLTIAMWDFSWLYQHYEGGFYEDYNKVCDELVERGFNTVRIDAFPLVIGKMESDDQEITIEGDPLRNWGASDRDRKHALVAELLEFMKISKEKNISVILSSWGQGALEFPDIRKDYADPADHWKAWEKVLDLLKENDLLSHVVYVDFDQEFPFFSPVSPELDRLGQVKKERSTSASAEMEAAGRIYDSFDGFNWNPQQMKFVRDYLNSTLTHFQRKYPENRFTFSITAYWKEVRAMNIKTFDVLELHFWLNQSERFTSRTGFPGLTKDRGNHDYKDYMDRLEKTMLSSRPMLMKDMHNRLAWAKEWSEEIGAPLTTTEAWGPWWHMDHKDLTWEWLYDWCEDGMRLSSEYQLWGTTPWNYSHPYWENWTNVEWYKKVNSRFLDNE